SGAYRPQITLMQVVLPDPFGPTSPSTSPAARWKLTPSSARKPPKRFTSFSTRRIGSGDTDAPPRQQRCQSVRQEQHQHHDQHAIDQLEILRHGDADPVVYAIQDQHA